MTRSNRLFGLFAVALISAQLLGCTGNDGKLDLVSVKGKVTLDGKPYGPATLTLQPTAGVEGDKRPVVGGVVEADGSYALTTYETGDGAPVGEYTATLGAPQSSGDGTTDPTQEAMAAMGGGNAPSTAPLKVTVPEGGSESLDLKFVSTKKKKVPMVGGAPVPQ